MKAKQLIWTEQQEEQETNILTMQYTKMFFFSKMADEYNNITNKEQLSFCIRTVDYNLEVKEDFLASMSQKT